MGAVSTSKKAPREVWGPKEATAASRAEIMAEFPHSTTAASLVKRIGNRSKVRLLLIEVMGGCFFSLAA